jgi:hypothetical protein
LRELLDSVALLSQGSKKELLSRARALMVVVRKRVRAILQIVANTAKNDTQFSESDWRMKESESE